MSALPGSTPFRELADRKREIERLRETLAKVRAHCTQWHGSCCPCDDQECPL